MIQATSILINVNSIYLFIYLFIYYLFITYVSVTHF